MIKWNKFVARFTDNGDEILGTESVYRIDGRLSLSNMEKAVRNRAEQLKKVKPFITGANFYRIEGRNWKPFHTIRIK